MHSNPILQIIDNQRNNASQQQQPNSNPQIQQLKELYSKLKNFSSPQEAVQAIISNNPQLETLIKLNNGNLQQVAEIIAKQRGIDLQSLVKELNSFMS